MKSYNYLLLLIHSQHNQGIALLETASPQQVTDLVRVLYNINNNKDILQPKSKSLLTKSKNVIKKLTAKNISEVGKYRIIRNNAKSFYNLLTSSKNLLSKVLQQ